MNLSQTKGEGGEGGREGQARNDEQRPNFSTWPAVHRGKEHFERLMPVVSFLLLGFSARRDCVTPFSDPSRCSLNPSIRPIRPAPRSFRAKEMHGFHFSDFALLRVADRYRLPSSI